MVNLFLSAFLVSAAFEPIGQWFLAIFGYALFFRKLSKTRKPVLYSFIFAFLANAIVLNWSSKYVGSLPWILLSLLQALFYIPVGWVQRRFSSLTLTIFAILLCEEVKARFPFGGFSWTRIAFSQVGSPYLPLVSIGGVLLLSAATLYLALVFSRFQLKSFALLAVSFILVSLIPANSSGSEKISLVAIQGNTPEIGLNFNSRAKAVFDLHLNTTRRFVQGKYDAIVWPENAIDIDPRKYPEVEKEIVALTKEFATPLIAGVVLTGNNGPENASVMYGQNSQISSTYIKRYLTPFGEYMPLRSLAEIASPYASSVVDFQAGDRLVTHRIRDAQIAPIICYEIINDGLVRESALAAGALLVQTNSATFAKTSESAQQLAITRIRAIEHARDILSVSTVGISAFIDNNGAVISKTQENVSASLGGALSVSHEHTWADRLGGVAPLLVLFLSWLVAIGRPRKFFAL